MTVFIFAENDTPSLNFGYSVLYQKVGRNSFGTYPALYALLKNTNNISNMERQFFTCRLSHRSEQMPGHIFYETISF